MCYCFIISRQYKVVVLKSSWLDQKEITEISDVCSDFGKWLTQDLFSISTSSKFTWIKFVLANLILNP